MHRLTGLMTLALAVCSGPASASEGPEIMGDWRTVRHSAEVRIEDCGDGSPCGFLISAGQDIVRGRTHDEHNRDPELRHRRLNGLPILWGYSRKAEGWRNGRLYNPETGQTFRSSLNLISSDRLRVKGCLGPFCREQTWTRIPASQTAQLQDK